MPIFYFDSLIDEKLLQDPIGIEFATAEEAIIEARQGARELAGDRLLAGLPIKDLAIVVRRGDELVATVTLDEVVR